jgi:hypothetical protein
MSNFVHLHLITNMNILKAIIFTCHFFFFGLTVLFFILKFHKKDKLKYIMFSVAIIWIIFGFIDFILELRSVLLMFI